ncbi:hypothetical protein KM043_005663 [Ampulex compressa]|nr:hypothetical protein KM043_005663 [Ampulex compressa]
MPRFSWALPRRPYRVRIEIIEPSSWIFIRLSSTITFDPVARHFNSARREGDGGAGPEGWGQGQLRILARRTAYRISLLVTSLAEGKKGEEISHKDPWRPITRLREAFTRTTTIRRQARKRNLVPHRRPSAFSDTFPTATMRPASADVPQISARFISPSFILAQKSLQKRLAGL